MFKNDTEQKSWYWCVCEYKTLSISATGLRPDALLHATVPLITLGSFLVELETP